MRVFEPRPAMLVAAVVASIACSGGGDDGGDDAGDAGATGDNVVAVPDTPELSFSAASALHGIGPSHTTVLLSDAPGLCAALGGTDAAMCAAQGVPLGSRFLRIDVAGTPPGTFSGSEVVAVAIAPGEVGVSAGAGQVELQAETADGTLSGSYDLGIVGQGTFTTARCDALGGGDGTEATSRACSTTLQVTGDVHEFQEECSCDGEASRRACTRRASDPEWTCACTAPSGAEATCTAAAPAGAVTPPPNCCP
jgi:hypothetical protein